jgi:chitodextrinase
MRTVAALILVGAVAASTSCTMKSQEAPPLTGPSEYGTSIVVTVTPDVLTQDGSSQSVVTIMARDPNGKPLRNVSLRSEIYVAGVAVDFGSLSARNLVTDSAGRATLVYTAPASPAGPAVDTNTTVNIVVTPLGTDYGNSIPRLATIRLVPTGTVVPQDGLRPYFAISNESPVDHELVLFDACNDPDMERTQPCAPANNPIATYSWDFGDGARATGQRATHSYGPPGTYVVRLTVTDFVGRSATTSLTVKVSLASDPTSADFTYSPDSPVSVGTGVTFDGSKSRAPQNSVITRYEWTFGDTTTVYTSGSPVITHTYAAPGNYIVTLKVYDNRGGDPLGVSTTRPITVR